MRGELFLLTLRTGILIADSLKVIGMDEKQAALTVRQLRWAFAGLVVAWLGCEVAALVGYSFSPLVLGWENIRASAHLSVALAGIVIFYFCSKPTTRECLRTVALGGLLAGGLKLLDVIFDCETPLVYALCCGLGVASLLMMAWRAWCSPGDARRQVLLVLLPACLVLGSIPLIYFFLCLTIELRPDTYDALTYAADGTLGMQLSFALGQLFEAVPLLANLSLLVYCTLPLAFMVLLVLSLRNQKPPLLELLPSFLCVAVCGFVTYWIFPLTGPRFAFAEAFPHAPPDVASVLAGPLTVSDTPRNCMPSLHTAWALLVWWHAQTRGRWLRLGAGAFLVFTMLAAVGFGAHYAFDVVVAFPSTLACRALCMTTPPTARRHTTILLGVVLTATWLFVLRYGLQLLALSPVLTASAALATMAAAVLLERMLTRAALLPIRNNETNSHPAIARTLSLPVGDHAATGPTVPLCPAR